ncbi:hypothetical protein WJX77_001495 [Trebouxia sp. C0004]
MGRCMARCKSRSTTLAAATSREKSQRHKRSARRWLAQPIKSRATRATQRLRSIRSELIWLLPMMLQRRLEQARHMWTSS